MDVFNLLALVTIRPSKQLTQVHFLHMSKSQTTKSTTSCNFMNGFRQIKVLRPHRDTTLFRKEAQMSKFWSYTFI